MGGHRLPTLDQDGTKRERGRGDEVLHLSFPPAHWRPGDLGHQFVFIFSFFFFFSFLFLSFLSFLFSLPFRDCLVVRNFLGTDCQAPP